MNLAVLLRTNPGTNAKPRPSWFSKAACAQSLVESLEACGSDFSLDVIADRGMPSEVEAVLAGKAQIHLIAAGNNRRSFLATLKVGLQRAREGADIVLFVEDDYLFTRQSMQDMILAAEESSADYFAPYTPDDSEWHATHPSQPLAPLREPFSTTFSNGKAWTQITHTTSTYGGRGDALVKDAWVIRAVPYAGSPIAHSTSATLQGYEPFSWLGLTRDLNLGRSLVAVGRSLTRPPLRVIVNVLARFMRRRKRVLIAPVTDIATHVEFGHVSAGPWEELSISLMDRVQRA